MCYTLLCANYSRTKCFKNCKNISTDGEVMAKIRVACFFLGHGLVEDSMHGKETAILKLFGLCVLHCRP